MFCLPDVFVYPITGGSRSACDCGNVLIPNLSAKPPGYLSIILSSSGSSCPFGREIFQLVCASKLRVQLIYLGSKIRTRASGSFETSWGELVSHVCLKGVSFPGSLSVLSVLSGLCYEVALGNRNKTARIRLDLCSFPTSLETLFWIRPTRTARNNISFLSPINP